MSIQIIKKSQQKFKFCHFLTLMLFQNLCFFLMLNIKEILWIMLIHKKDTYTGLERHEWMMTEAPQCNRMTATAQDTDNRRTIYKFTKWQKHNIQYRHLCVRSDVQIWNEKKNMCVWWINNCIIVLCVPCLMSSVHEMDCLGEETVSVSGCSGAQSSVASTRR